MLKWLAHIKDFLSLDYRSLFILTTLSWVILFIPINVWQGIGLFDVWQLARPWIFIIGLSTLIWLFSGGIFDLIKNIVNYVKKRQESSYNKKSREKTILSTSRIEREILARYLYKDVTTVGFDIRDGVVNGLILKGILFRASTVSNPMSYDFDINIEPWVWEFLKDHPEFMDGIKPTKLKRHHLNF